MKQYDLDLPAHLLTEQVQTDIYKQASSGIGVWTGADLLVHDRVASLIHDWQEQQRKIIALQAEVGHLKTEANNSSVNTLRERMLKQEQDEIAQEAWLRERLKLLRFPYVEDVYVSYDDPYESIGFFPYDPTDDLEAFICPLCGKRTEYWEGQIDQDVMGNDIRGYSYDCYDCKIHSAAEEIG